MRLLVSVGTIRLSPTRDDKIREAFAFYLAHSGCPSNAKFDISNSTATEEKSSPIAYSSCAPPVK
jgi:hypothetical protein